MEEGDDGVASMTARMFFSDSATALRRQLEVIFTNLRTAPDIRPTRVEECLYALMDTVASHASEIGAHEGLLGLLFHFVEMTFDESISKGVRAYQVVFDILLGDQHEKRGRCLDLLVRKAMKTTSPDDRAVILNEVVVVLEENTRSTTDLLGLFLSSVVNTMQNSIGVRERTVCCELLERTVTTSASVIRRNPSLLEVLCRSCEPMALLCQAGESRHRWHLEALVRLLTTLITESYFEESVQMASQAVEMVHGYMSSAKSERELVGALSLLHGLVDTPPFSTAPWNLTWVCVFLTEHNWSTFSTETRALAVSVSCKVAFSLCQENECLFVQLFRILMHFVATDNLQVATRGLEAAYIPLKNGCSLPCVADFVACLRICILRHPYTPLAFEVLLAVREIHGDDVMLPIYSMLDEYLRDLSNADFATMNALLRFMGYSAPLNRPDVRQLAVDVSLDRQTVPAVLRSLPLLTTLGRTDQIDDVVQHLTHEDASIRLAALTTAVALCELIIGSAGSECRVAEVPQRLDDRVISTVERVLDVGVADRNPELRLRALTLLSASFYPYLCMFNNLESLFMARNDIYRPVADQALVLLCRLHPYRPSVVHPQLLRMQEHMQRDIEAQDSSISAAIYKADLLKMCADNGALLLEPKVVEEVAMQRLHHQSLLSKKLSISLLRLTRSVLEHEGNLDYCDTSFLLQPVIAIINDSYSTKCRKEALETLCAILTTANSIDSANAIEVYRCIARIIWSEMEEEAALTVAAMKALSTIGAANPVKIRRILRVLEADEMGKTEEVVTPALMHNKPRNRIGPNMEERYPAVLLYYLVRSLQLTTDPRHQVEILTAVRSMMKAISNKQRAALLTQFFPHLQAWLLEPEKAPLYENVLLLMTDLSELLRQCKELIPSHIGSDLLLSVQHFCMLPQASQKPLNVCVVELLDALAKVLPPQEMRDNRWAVDFIYQRLSQDKNNLNLVLRLVESLESFLVVMYERDLVRILPHVLQCIEPAKMTPTDRRPKMKDINAACFDFLSFVMMKQASLVKDCCAEIVHTILWYIELSDNEEEMDHGLATLAELIDVVNAPARRFIPQVERVAQKIGYPAEHFTGLVKSISTFSKTRAPSGQMETFNPDLPLTLVSHLPRLTQVDFESELRRTMRITAEMFEVLRVEHQNGQSVINFRFSTGDDQQTRFRHFTQKAQERQSTLHRNLGILRLEQSRVTPCHVDGDIITGIANIPSANKKKREQSWITWLHNTSVTLLKHTPFLPMRCAAAIAEHNSDVSRDLFPFVASSIIEQLDHPSRLRLMNAFSTAVEVAPNDIKQNLFALAEFMESERGEQRSVLMLEPRYITCAVERETADGKFGVTYDQDPTHGVIVTKVAPNGPGAQAGVPVGAYLKSVNGHPVESVKDIRHLIEGMTRVELTFLHYVEERHTPQPKILMDIAALAKVAFTSQMHAKGIYFNEVLFQQLFCELGQVASRKDASVRRLLDATERLIELYGQLGLTMEAKGLVKAINIKFTENIIAPEQFGFDEIGTLEQLNWWSDALDRYQSRMINPDDGSLDLASFTGLLRCEEALGQMEVAKQRIDEYWPQLDETARLEVTPYRARAAFTMGTWDIIDSMAIDTQYLEKFGVVERCAALFRMGNYETLLGFIEQQRDSMVEPFSESFNESYSRSYDALVQLQHLRHFEELVSYANSSDERRTTLRKLWHKRLAQLSPRPSNLLTLLSINSLVLTPMEDVSSRVMGVRLLTKAQWYSAARIVLTGIIGPNEGGQELYRQDPELIHAYMKHCYATKSRHESYSLLRDILRQVKVEPEDPRAEAWGWCWLLLGEWTVSLFPDHGDQAIEELLRATVLSPRNYAAFHALGILHYDLSRDPTASPAVPTDHHISAVIALFRSVQLCSDHSNNVVQDTLRILSIWFAHSTATQLNEAINRGVQILPDHVWLYVIPQLIARIGITAKLARAILADLLVRVGTKYPHALIYPLTVAEKSPDAVRRLMAERVLAGIRVTSDQTVEEASLISNEMVRIAILWTEKWHAAIQQAAAKHDNARVIMKILEPMFSELDNTETPHEQHFVQSFGKLLREARVALKGKNLDQVWVLLKQVYMHLGKLVSERRIHLSEVSPILDSIRDSIVAVPGTFQHGKPLITIQKFHPRVYVMPSKQKPRRFGLDASNGQPYRFLLKGHEDLRQDERVMQFIGLVDTTFLADNAASSIGLTIPQYAVIPLTDNVGIIGWVENTETIYKMLETHRRDHNVSMYEEVHLITRKGSLRAIDDYHRLPKAQRKLLLSYAMSENPDDELRRIIWDKNDTCEQWLRYRETYGNTLAAMSMVGYVLGLGDRHLNNLMLQGSGSVVHIDFGDCFEEAMHRSLYAEAVPFRLTRLLVAALGITGVDGVYRLTCELVMKSLRTHRENLLSILEAFIYDPLINWRFNTTEIDNSISINDGRRSQNAPQGGIQSVNPLHDVEEVSAEPALQLSCGVAPRQSYATQYNSVQVGAVTLEAGEEETRNALGDQALARVHAKLTGQDFSIVNSSFSMNQSARRIDDPRENSSSWASHSGLTFGDSAKDGSVVGPLLTTYLPVRALGAGTECLDVPHQVDRLIREATSLDNLSEAFITGWAPFW